MGCDNSKISPFEGTPVVAVNKLLEGDLDPSFGDGFVRVIGIAKPVAATTPLLRSPFLQSVNANALIHHVTAKKQPSATGTNTRKCILAFKAYMAVPCIRLVDTSDPTTFIIVRFTKDANYSLKFQSKIFNLEYDPKAPNDLYGGGKKGTRSEMRSIPKTGLWWETVAGHFDSRGSFQSRESKFAFGFQRAVWNRSLQPNDLVVIKAKMVSATTLEKEVHGENVRVVELGPESALSNVEKEVSKYLSNPLIVGGGSGNDDEGIERDVVLVDMRFAPIQLVKTNMKTLNQSEIKEVDKLPNTEYLWQ